MRLQSAGPAGTNFLGLRGPGSGEQDFPSRYSKIETAFCELSYATDRNSISRGESSVCLGNLIRWRRPARERKMEGLPTGGVAYFTQSLPQFCSRAPVGPWKLVLPAAALLWTAKLCPVAEHSPLLLIRRTQESIPSRRGSDATDRGGKLNCTQH